MSNATTSYPCVRDCFGVRRVGAAALDRSIELLVHHRDQPGRVLCLDDGQPSPTICRVCRGRLGGGFGQRLSDGQQSLAIGRSAGAHAV
jgi:hypothetical protein